MADNILMTEKTKQDSKEIKETSRINLIVADDTKDLWQDFVDKNDKMTLSSLIRDAVNIYIKSNVKKKEIQSISTYAHGLKEELNSIKGFSQMLIQEYKDELSWDILVKLKEIYDKSINIEKIMKKILNVEVASREKYDVLIIDDDDSTIYLLTEFFKKKGISTLYTSSAIETFDILQYSNPKLILLDILLPGENGYEICKKIQNDERLKDIPIYYITAVPESEVREKLKETGADGFIAKPFDIEKFDALIKQYNLRLVKE